MGRKSQSAELLPLSIENVPKFTVIRLKEELTKLNQPVTGTKAVLSERLLQALQGIFKLI